MHPHQRDFLDLALRLGVLRFGKFTLKSGRESPYFFNAGMFYPGSAIGGLGRAYAAMHCYGRALECFRESLAIAPEYTPAGEAMRSARLKIH